MDADEVKCPDGHRLTAERDVLVGIARINSIVVTDGELDIDWEGYTDVDWNSQEPALEMDEREDLVRVFICEDDKEWLETELIRPQPLGL